MANLNRCEFIGRICQDLESKTTPSGAIVLNFSLAVNEKYTAKSGEKVENTEFIRCVAWNKPAELISEYCRKGSQLYVDGKMTTREWETTQGEKRYTTEIIVRQMQFLDSKNSQPSTPADHQEPPATGNTGQDFDSSDVPF